MFNDIDKQEINTRLLWQHSDLSSLGGGKWNTIELGVFNDCSFIVEHTTRFTKNSINTNADINVKPGKQLSGGVGCECVEGTINRTAHLA